MTPAIRTQMIAADVPGAGTIEEINFFQNTGVRSPGARNEPSRQAEAWKYGLNPCRPAEATPSA